MVRKSLKIIIYVSQNPGETMYNDYVKNAYEAENQANERERLD